MGLATVALLAGAGFLAGFIDSIAGGGGLITIPTLIFVVGAGAQAIGTNKIVGLSAAAVAFFVYSRGGHFAWRKSAAFAAWVGVGSFLGSRVAPHVPPEVFRWLLAVTCPVILWIVWRKDLWVAREVAHEAAGSAGPGLFSPQTVLAGLACGFYDGVWGPGAGTFMFLTLLFLLRLPLFSALAASRFVNTLSALVSLCSYAQGGYVRWGVGLPMAVGIGAGAFFGATHATRSAARIIRPMLAVVALLLLVKILTTR